MTNEPVFEVTFRCNNCGNLWPMQFEAEIKVKAESALNQRVVVYKKTHTSLADRTCTIECPVCKVDEVRIISRIPLKDKVMESANGGK